MSSSIIRNAGQDASIIFCDGACSGNPGPGGWGAIVATPDGSIREMGGAAPSTTNNRMELTAAIESLRVLEPTPGPVLLHTDSTYVIRGITQWVFAWRRRGWKTASGEPVANRELWEDLSQTVAQRGKANAITWRYVRGHSGTPGNERADAIAVAFSKGAPPALYSGPGVGYGFSFEISGEGSGEVSGESPGLPSRLAPSSGGKPVYLSLVDAIPMRHATWADCERRVRGQSGAKFKKVSTPDEEAAVLRKWGSDPRRVK